MSLATVSNTVLNNIALSHTPECIVDSMPVTATIVGVAVCVFCYSLHDDIVPAFAEIPLGMAYESTLQPESTGRC